MADTDVNIALRVNGASDAKTALDQAANGLQGISDKHDQMSGRFQKRIQHIGLQLFAVDALRANGLGAEARGMISLLNTGLMGLGTAAGLGSGGLMLIVAALGAIVGVIVKVIEHHKTLIDELNKEIDANTKLSKSYSDSLKVIDDYAKEFGKLTGFVKDNKKSEEEAKEATDKSTIALVQGKIAATNMEIVKIKESIAANEDLKNKIQDLDSTTKAYVGGSAAVANSVDNLNKSHKDLNDQLVKTREELTKEEGQIIALIHGYSSYDDMLKANIKAHQDLGKASEEAAKKAKEAWEADQKELDKVTEEGQKDADAYNAKQTELTKHLKDMWAHTGDAIAKQIGDSFAKMIVEGKSFTDGFKALMTNMVEEFISDVVRMEIEWLAFEAMTGAAGGFTFMPKFQATGTSQFVTEPTMFIAGESGPEFVNVTPSSQMGLSGGGGGNVSVGNVYVTVQGVNDPKEIANQVGAAIISRIRGRGDLAFARG